MCDADTIYGTVFEGFPADITLTVYRVNCGGDNVIASGSPDSSGYYAFGNLETGRLEVVADEDGYYGFAPIAGYWTDMPQIVIKSHDFTKIAD